MTMPKTIQACPRGSGTISGVWTDNKCGDEPETPYIRYDLYEALEAQNKMLAEAVLGLASKDIHVSRFAPTTHAEAIALAQRIGGRE